MRNDKTNKVLRKALMYQISHRSTPLCLLSHKHREILVDRAMQQPPIVEYADPVDIPPFPPTGYYACFASQY